MANMLQIITINIKTLESAPTDKTKAVIMIFVLLYLLKIRRGRKALNILNNFTKEIFEFESM